MQTSHARWLIAAALLLLTGGCSTGQHATGSQSLPGEAASPADFDRRPSDFATVEVVDVIPTKQGHAILLRDPVEEAMVPIFVGQSQALAIKLRLERRRYNRPLTHDLLDNVVTRLGGEIVKVHVDALKGGVFVGTVFLRRGDEVYKVDARSSDAIALALGNQAPIYVADSVFERAGISLSDLRRGSSQKRPEPPEAQGPYY